MAAWVIREERQGEPIEAFQLEEMEVPEPGAFEVTVRVMAAGVNFNNVWAALGQPVSVFRSHAEDHHIGGSDASGIVWKVGEGVTRWKPGDEVVMHCNQASYEDPEVHGLDPLAAPSQQIWGYETTWGSFAQFCKVQAQQLLPKPANLTWEEAASYGLTYFTAYRMLIDQAAAPGGPPRADLGRRGRARRVRHPALRGWPARESVGVVSSRREGRAGRAARRRDLIDRNEFAGHDAPRRRGRRARSRRASRSRGGSARPSRRCSAAAARHRVRARRPGDVPHVGAGGQAVRQGRDLRRDVGLPARLRRPLPVDAPEARSSARTSPTRGSATEPTS